MKKKIVKKMIYSGYSTAELQNIPDCEAGKTCTQSHLSLKNKLYKDKEFSNEEDGFDDSDSNEDDDDGVKIDITSSPEASHAAFESSKNFTEVEESGSVTQS